MPDNTTVKVRLKDPATSNYLYPATGLNAIYAGTSGDAATLSIIDGSSKIYARYLQIVDTTTNKVTSNYLPITFTNTGLIASASLGIFDGNGKISPDLLPSYVDDVVEIPVLTQAPPYPAGKLFILDNGDGTYNFYQKNDNNEWGPGGGNAGTIYVDSAGDIFRAIAGATYPDPDAAKISQSPYVIDQSITSGVQLVLNNGTLSAQGVVATTQSAGVVKVSTANTNGAALTIAADGTLAATATVGDNTHPGTVVVAGTTADYNYAKTPAGGNHADSYIVPTVKFMYDYVDEYVPSVDFATTGNPGIVRIDPNGHITVGDSGVIAVPSAAQETWGVVQIVNDVDTTVDGNATRAVTQAGIVRYVASALTGYQPKLTPGSGIDITERVISTKIQAPIVFNGGIMTVQDGSSAAPGVVMITGDSSYIDIAASTIGTHPVAVNPKAVYDYVSNTIASLPITIHPATDLVLGGFKTSGTSTGLQMTSAPNGTVNDILAVKVAAPLTIDTFNQITALPAAVGTIGAVKIRTLADAAAADDVYAVPQAWDVKHYVDTAITGATYAAGSSIDATQLAAGTIAVIKASHDSHGAVKIAGPSSGFGIANGVLTLDKATSQTMGGVQIGTGIAVNDGTISVQTYAAGSSIDTTQFAAGTVAVIKASYTSHGAVKIKAQSSGLAITDGELELSAATSQTLGGVKIGSNISVDANGVISVDTGVNDPAHYVTTPTDETTSLGGVRIVSGSGIEIVRNADDELTGNLKLSPATTASIGGVVVFNENTGLKVDPTGHLSISRALPLYVEPNTNELAVSSATIDNLGVVKITTYDGTEKDFTSKAQLPTGSAVSSFVTDKIAAAMVGMQEQIVPGDGLKFGDSDLTSNTLSVDYTSPIYISASTTSPATYKLSVSAGVGADQETLGNAAFGAVWVRTEVRSAGAALSNDPRKASTVPTESAVRALVDAIPYITYEQI